MKLILAIAAGGALGAVGRHLLAHQISLFFGGGFPLGILVCNVLGSFLMGVLVEGMALAWSVSLEMRAFLAVGVLGAFTTFSTFSLDAVLLIQRGDLGKAGLYIAASVMLSILGLMLGLQAVRSVLA